MPAFLNACSSSLQALGNNNSEISHVTLPISPATLNLSNNRVSLDFQTFKQNECYSYYSVLIPNWCTASIATLECGKKGKQLWHMHFDEMNWCYIEGKIVQDSHFIHKAFLLVGNSTADMTQQNYHLNNDTSLKTPPICQVASMVKSGTWRQLRHWWDGLKMIFFHWQCFLSISWNNKIYALKLILHNSLINTHSQGSKHKH